MQADDTKAGKGWDIRGKSAIVPALVGVVIICFVAITRGEYGAWTLWIAVPLLMASLGYMAIVNLIPIMLGFEYDSQSKEEDEKPGSE